MRPIFIGLDPGRYRTEPLDPSGGSGGLLADLCGIELVEFLRRTDRTNLFPTPNSRSVVEARLAARNLRPLLRGRRVVALGRVAADAIGVCDWMDWSVRDGCVCAAVPHPSGLNRWWNEPRNRIAARGFLRMVVRPCVHVEGPDGSGKTTLVQGLSRTLNLGAIPTEDPPSSWAECLGRIQRRIRPGIVCDRSSGLVSELVYGPVLRGGTIVGESTLWQAVRSILYAVVFVYCRPSSLLASSRPGESREHTSSVQLRQEDLAARYDDVIFRIAGMGGRVVVYDRDRVSVEEVARCVE